MVTKTPPRSRHLHLYLAEWMELRGLDDKGLANKLGVSRVTVTRYREQQHRLDVEKIARIAKALDIEPQELWRPPGRVSIDAMLKPLSDEAVKRAADGLALLLKTE